MGIAAIIAEKLGGLAISKFFSFLRHLWKDWLGFKAAEDKGRTKEKLETAERINQDLAADARAAEGVLSPEEVDKRLGEAGDFRP